MPTLASHVYGKSNIRLTRVTRHRTHHDLHEISVDIALHGAFEKSYLAGDNSQIVATDTMKNTVYALAKTHPFTAIESFAADLAAHFLNNNAHITSASIVIRQHTWHRLSPIAFEGASSEIRTTTVTTSRAAQGLVKEIMSGLDGLLVLKTTDSAFVGFLRDGYTTLPEVTDRIFATIITATWNYTAIPADANAAHAKARATMLEVFAEHKSLAVQQTLFQMGKAVLAAVPEMREITITMPNQHRIPANLKALGMEFENDIFVTTDEPFGNIAGTITR